MPTYQYKCLNCKHTFETFQKITDSSLTECPRCFGRLQKVYFPAGIIFKGPGFYITDSRAEKEKRESKLHMSAEKSCDVKDMDIPSNKDKYTSENGGKNKE